jgi:Protein of unknown function (DUF3987)
MKSKSTSKTQIEDCDQSRRCRVVEARDSAKRYRGLVVGKAAQLRRERMSSRLVTATFVACAAEDSSTSAERWARPNLELLEDRRGDLPELPVESLGPATQLWLGRAARAAGVTPAHVFAPAISITSTLVGAARRVRASSSFSQPLCVWSAVIAPSGEGKTPGLDASRRPLAAIECARQPDVAQARRAHEEQKAIAKARMQEWKAAVKEARADGKTLPPMPPDEPEPFVAQRLWVADATVPKVAILVQARPRGLVVIVDELAGLFLALARGEREFWLQAWNGGAHIVERIGREPVAIEHLLVGLTGGLQPDKLERVFGGDEDGFYARILFAWTSAPDYFPLPNDVPEVDSQFGEALMRLIELPDGLPGKLQPRELNLDADALCALEDFRRANRDQRAALDGRERDWIAKGPGQVLRLAGVLVYLEWALQGPHDQSRDASALEALRQIAKSAAEPTIITGNDMRKAIALFDNYFWPHARAALRQIGLSDRHREERRVLRWARAKKIATLSRETVRREIFSQRIDAERAQAIIEALVEAGWLREVTMKGRQHRPARRWQLNPLLEGGRSGRLRATMARTWRG